MMMLLEMDMKESFRIVEECARRKECIGCPLFENPKDKCVKELANIGTMMIRRIKEDAKYINRLHGEQNYIPRPTTVNINIICENVREVQIDAEDICKTTNLPCIKCNPGPCEHRKKG